MEFWMEKHPFYEGLSLPLDKLDDKRFSSFINCCSEFLFPGTEADITPPETHDNGFDYRRKISNTANTARVIPPFRYFECFMNSS